MVYSKRGYIWPQLVGAVSWLFRHVNVGKAKELAKQPKSTQQRIFDPAYMLVNNTSFWMTSYLCYHSNLIRQIARVHVITCKFLKETEKADSRSYIHIGPIDSPTVLPGLLLKVLPTPSNITPWKPRGHTYTDFLSTVPQYDVITMIDQDFGAGAAEPYWYGRP